MIISADNTAVGGGGGVKELLSNVTGSQTIPNYSDYSRFIVSFTLNYYDGNRPFDIVVPLGESRWYGYYGKSENQYYYYVTAASITISNEGVITLDTRYASEWNDKASWTSTPNPTYSVYGLD